MGGKREKKTQKKIKKKKKKVLESEQDFDPQELSLQLKW